MFTKKKQLYCRNCKCYTPHKYLGKDRDELADEIALAVFSLGLSLIIRDEPFCGYSYFECTKCKTIQQDD